MIKKIQTRIVFLRISTVKKLKRINKKCQFWRITIKKILTRIAVLRIYTIKKLEREMTKNVKFWRIPTNKKIQTRIAVLRISTLKSLKEK